MADYQYSALDRAGKEVSGTLSGRDQRDAAQKVRALGYYPVKVVVSDGRSALVAERDERRPARGTAAPSAGGKKVRRLEILLFTRELADLIGAGLPIDRALSVLIEQSDSEALQAMVRHLQGDIRAGKPLSEAMGAFPREFPELYANMARAGEVSGQLPAVLERLADFLEKEQMRRSQIMAALTYPAVLITVATFAVTFLLTFVIPKLRDVFTEMGAALPVPTQILLGFSGFVGHYWWCIGLVIVGGWLALRAWRGTAAGRREFDRIRLTAPVLGPLTKKMVMARFVRTLGTLLGGGVPILESLEIASTAVGNSLTADQIGDARDRVRQGETLSGSLEQTGGFLPIVVHMAAVGEETGRLSAMLIRTASTLDFEVDSAMRKMTSLVEPLVVLLMGGFVGFIVLSILLPIFQANTLVK